MRDYDNFTKTTFGTVIPKVVASNRITKDSKVGTFDGFVLVFPPVPADRADRLQQYIGIVIFCSLVFETKHRHSQRGGSPHNKTHVFSVLCYH